MPSPFPGMNPFLEQEDVWHSFHEHFIPACMEVLTPQVRPRYIVKVDEHLFIHELPAEPRQFVGRADLAVKSRASDAAGTATALPAAPAYGRIPQAIDVERQSFLQILDRQSRRVVTAVELLSPSNKYAGPDREQYLAKRQQLLSSAVHLVEIDLLRGGPRLPIEGLPVCAYYAMVSRSEDRPDVALWPVSLREPLPEIPIPLHAPDSPARLDLQALLHRLYDAAGYEDYIYSGSPQPALTAADVEWSRQILGQR
jgi:hypothetical protein